MRVLRLTASNGSPNKGAGEKIYEAVRHRLDVEQGLADPYGVRARDAVITGGIIAAVAFAVGAALQGDAPRAPGWALGLFWFGVAIMACAWRLRRRERASWTAQAGHARR
jgi:hypothetical protein